MIVSVSFTYHEHNVVPRRCRKPRTVTHSGCIDMEIPEVSADQAPAAFILQSWHEDRPAEVIRWWDERLWEPYKPWSGQIADSLPGSNHFPAIQQASVPYDLHGLEAAERHVKATFGAQYLIIDGTVWRSAGEPRYEIYALGLGHNHSCSGLGTAQCYNSNVHRGWYFRADQFQEARAEAIRVAQARGDTNSLQWIPDEPLIQVLIPEAVRCEPSQEAGDGDPFLNQLRCLTAAAGSAEAAGVLVTALATVIIDK